MTQRMTTQVPRPRFADVDLPFGHMHRNLCDIGRLGLLDYVDLEATWHGKRSLASWAGGVLAAERAEARVRATDVAQQADK